ncbi:MAG: Hsp20/alpha crystallin family protein [Actinobacteria bacterium]|nr:Hsp20/alpha crystallin family protein [Actinomycetota bacterium]
MAIVKWDPFDAFLGLQEDLNKMFRKNWLVPGAEEGMEGIYNWAPAVDIYETDNSLVVEAELSGLQPGDIDVSIDNNIVTIKGERKKETEVKEENYHRIERASGVFQRSIRLPSEVDAEKIEAAYENGVLKVTIPKVEPKKAKKIPIKASKKEDEE